MTIMDNSFNSNLSVIVVDDDQDILDMLRTYFSDEGHACQAVSNAKEALALIEQGSFDLILTDIVLPEMNGLELCEKVKALNPGAQIIVMTGFGANFSYDKAIESGASDFIKKPFTLQELMARIKILRMKEDLLRWAITDELTGVYNRKGFFTLADHLLKLSKRNNQGVYLLYADMDHLKDINDRYGHREGDLALAETATLLRRNYRESDIIARIGGDEFVVLPVGTTDDSVHLIGERLGRALELHNNRPGTKYGISLSWGAAYFDPASPCSVDELLVEADKAMYEMKKGKK